MFEKGLFDFGLVKRGMVELATVKRKGKTKFVTGVKPKSLHFAVFEGYVPKRCLVEFCQTEIAPVKRTADELKFGKVAAGNVATVENTVFVFAFCERIVLIKRFVLYVDFLHWSGLSFRALGQIG